MLSHSQSRNDDLGVTTDALVDQSSGGACFEVVSRVRRHQTLQTGRSMSTSFRINFHSGTRTYQHTDGAPTQTASPSGTRHGGRWGQPRARLRMGPPVVSARTPSRAGETPLLRRCRIAPTLRADGCALSVGAEEHTRTTATPCCSPGVWMSIQFTHTLNTLSWYGGVSHDLRGVLGSGSTLGAALGHSACIRLHLLRGICDDKAGNITLDGIITRFFASRRRRSSCPTPGQALKSRNSG